MTEPDIDETQTGRVGSLRLLLRNPVTAVSATVLVVVLAGSVLAATTASLPLLILARVLQGASFALYPIGVSILREELPASRLMGAMAIISGVLGFGGGVVSVGSVMVTKVDWAPGSVVVTPIAWTENVQAVPCSKPSIRADRSAPGVVAITREDVSPAFAPQTL